MPDTNSGTVESERLVVLMMRSTARPRFRAATTPPRIESGTTITKATAASLSERRTAGKRNELTGALYWYEVPSLPWNMPEIQLQYWTTSGRSTPSLWSSSFTACSEARLPEDRPSRVAGQHLSGEEDDHAQEHEGEQGQADPLHDVLRQTERPPPCFPSRHRPTWRSRDLKLSVLGKVTSAPATHTTPPPSEVQLAWHSSRQPRLTSGGGTGPRVARFRNDIATRSPDDQGRAGRFAGRGPWLLSRRARRAWSVTYSSSSSRTALVERRLLVLVEHFLVDGAGTCRGVKGALARPAFEVHRGRKQGPVKAVAKARPSCAAAPRK